ncbi:MAG TPA: hypothetical protein VJ673_18370 [Aromatoleum sp.]|uniref:hypothetical protein n=1 Tax=Aromatoleum sp. TaxID=2307007 RepID=UPI002B48A663|nr:hypothetical protein [Aromatoleum sp.]HJV27659.1 hypothetical protein [Aromatoleum sp.]
MRPQYSIVLPFVLMCLATAHSSAEVVLDKTFDVKPAILPIEKFIKSYATPRAKGTFNYNIWVQNGRMRGGNSVFGWRVSGKRYVSAIAWYTSNLDPLPDCDDNSYDCDWIVDRHTICHLFLFDADTLTLAGVTPLNLARDRRLLKGKPRCQDVKAMSVAEVVPDTMLITLGYSDSAEPAETRYDPPEFVTTVALHFDPTPGVLRVEQRDKCLGNPNGLKTIAAARKKLRECEAEKARAQ